MRVGGGGGGGGFVKPPRTQPPPPPPATGMRSFMDYTMYLVFGDLQDLTVCMVKSPTWTSTHVPNNPAPSPTARTSP